MLNLYKIISKFIAMSALTDGSARCFIKVLFALFTPIAFSVKQSSALIHRDVIVPIFIFVCADARFCARSKIERVFTVFMEITIR